MASAMEVIPVGIGSEGSNGASRTGSVGNALTLENCRESVKAIFAGTSCYDLISTSSKTIVFETTIPFQLAFYALIEHDAQVAPLWSPTTHSFTGLMTVADYLRALKMCRKENITTVDLSTRSIADLIDSPGFEFQHPDFSSIDAEDSVSQMCFFLNRQGTNFVPIVNPDDGALVAILGYLDLIHLLDQASKQQPHLFTATLEEMNINIVDADTKPVTPSTPLLHILDSENNSEGGFPIVDETGVVVGIYYGTDVTFVTSATDPHSVLTNLETCTVQDIVQLQRRQQQQQQQTGESTTSIPPLITCTVQDKISDILAIMMAGRSFTVVVVDEARRYVGSVSVREIVTFYLS